MAIRPEMAIWPEMAFRQEMTFQSEMAFQPELAFRPEMAFWQKWLFGRNCFSAKNTFVKFEVAFWLELALGFSPNLIKEAYLYIYNSSAKKSIDLVKTCSNLLS